MYSMIIGLDENNLIGNGDNLPWYIPADFKHFKNKTLKKIVVMGKKTYDSIGKPLPERINVVITTDVNFKEDGVIVFNTIKDFEIYAAKQSVEIIIIGGANLLSQLYDNIDTLYLTHIHYKFKGDCHIDFIDLSKLNLVEFVSNKIEDGHKYNFDFCTYKKK